MSPARVVVAASTLCAMTTRWTLGCDASEPQRLAAFWREALGYGTERGFDDEDNVSLIDPDDNLPAISFLRVPEGKTAKNRMHIDIRVAAGLDVDLATREEMVRAKVADVVALGAVFVREEYYGPDLGHVVMNDPEGNEFCVA